MRVILFLSFVTMFTAINAELPQRKNAADLSTLKLVQITFRHGDRTPIVQYPKDALANVSWSPWSSGGFGQITIKGKQMHYNFGKYLRSRYNGFLNVSWTPMEINVQSSDADRAIMSAQSNLAGMWPPFNGDPRSKIDPSLQGWQPVPIRTIPGNIDNFIRFGADCPRFEELKRFYINGSEFAIQVNNLPEVKQVCSVLLKEAGVDHCDFETISDLWDTMTIQKNYGFQLASWINPIYNTMQKYSAVFFDMRVLVGDLESKRVKGGPLMNFLTTNMEKKVKGDADVPKMFVLSGHDSTSSIALGCLGVFDTQFPAYASSAIFELHEDSSNGYIVRVFFRNDTTFDFRSSDPPYEFEIPGCGYPCKFEKFQEIVAPIRLDGDDWKDACKSKNSGARSVQVATFSLIIYIFGLVFFTR